MERNLYKDLLITFKYKQLHIDQITGISIGKIIDDETEIIYQDLQPNECESQKIQDELLLFVNYNMRSGYSHSVKVNTLQFDGITGEFIIQVNGRGIYTFFLKL